MTTLSDEFYRPLQRIVTPTVIGAYFLVETLAAYPRNLAFGKHPDFKVITVTAMVFSQSEAVPDFFNTSWITDDVHVAERISKEYFVHSWPKWTFQIFLVVIGVFSNSLIILSFAKQRKNNVTSYYILFLAFVDMVGCCVIIPLHIILLSANYYSFTNTLSCKLQGWVKSACLASESLILQATALDRYQAVRKPFVWRRITATKTVLTLTICVVLGFTLSLPTFLLNGIQVYHFQRSTLETYGFSNYTYSGLSVNYSGYIYVCEILNIYQNSWEAQIYGVVSLLIFVVLVSLTMFSYTAIYLTMRRQLRSHGQNVTGFPAVNTVQPIQDQDQVVHVQVREQSLTTDGPSLLSKPSDSAVNSLGVGRKPHNKTRLKDIRQTQYKATRALMVVAVVFILSWIPFWIYGTLSSFATSLTNYNEISQQIVWEFSVDLIFLNNAVNGIVYYVYNRSFRHYCKAVFGMKCCR